MESKVVEKSLGDALRLGCFNLLEKALEGALLGLDAGSAGDARVEDAKGRVLLAHVADAEEELEVAPLVRALEAHERALIEADVVGADGALEVLVDVAPRHFELRLHAIVSEDRVLDRRKLKALLLLLLGRAEVEDRRSRRSRRRRNKSRGGRKGRRRCEGRRRRRSRRSR